MVQSSDQRFLLVSAVINKPFPIVLEFLVQHSFCQLLFMYWLVCNIHNADRFHAKAS